MKKSFADLRRPPAGFDDQSHNAGPPTQAIHAAPTGSAMAASLTLTAAQTIRMIDDARKKAPAPIIQRVLPAPTPINARKKRRINDDEDEDVGATKFRVNNSVMRLPSTQMNMNVGIDADIGADTHLEVDREVSGAIGLGESATNMGRNRNTGAQIVLPPDVTSQYLNSREHFTRTVNSEFHHKYASRISSEAKNSLTCRDIEMAIDSGEDIPLLTHQMVVRDYMGAYMPFRGVLVKHDLGTGKSRTSIIIAEEQLNASSGTKRSKCIVMTPASLETNFKQERIKYGDAKNETKYTYVHYNGMTQTKMKDMTENFTINPFDDATVIIDEAHNFVGMIVNKLLKLSLLQRSKISESTHAMLQIYHLLMDAVNARVVMLTANPFINNPIEISVFYNILRGYIKTHVYTIASNGNFDSELAVNDIRGDNTTDYVSYDATHHKLNVTRNPFGFLSDHMPDANSHLVDVNKVRANFPSGQLSPTDLKKLRQASVEALDASVEKIVMNHGGAFAGSPSIVRHLALPDNYDDFVKTYIDFSTKRVINRNALMRRIVGLTSYFVNTNTQLFPRSDRIMEYVEMSNFQYGVYKKVRTREIDIGRNSKKNRGDVFTETSSVYRIYSRQVCNFAIEDRPYIQSVSKKDAQKNMQQIPVIAAAIQPADGDTNGDENEGGDADADIDADIDADVDADVDNDDETNGGNTIAGRMHHMKSMYRKEYATALDNLYETVVANPKTYLHPDALKKHSPKFLKLLHNVNTLGKGKHLIYTQFYSFEGIRLLSAMFDANGYSQITLVKDENGEWKINVTNTYKLGQPAYILYTGSTNKDHKEMLRNIFNGSWNKLPSSLQKQINVFETAHKTGNKMGEIAKMFLITSSGAEGISLFNTNFVHFMESYWNAIREDQVGGRANRTCSHYTLPNDRQFVRTFIYITRFSAEQKKNGTIENATSDEYLYTSSQNKKMYTDQFNQIIKEASVDCQLYAGDDGKCLNFNSSNGDAFSYRPNYRDEQTDDMRMRNTATHVQNDMFLCEHRGIKYAAKRVVDADKNVVKYMLYTYNSYIQLRETREGNLVFSHDVYPKR